MQTKVLQQSFQLNNLTNMRRKGPKTYLLDEDEHLQNLRKIIKRDFFQTKQEKLEQQQQVIPLNLNDYIKNFKSNQNHIFAQLVHNDSQQWKQKHQWMQRSKQLMLQSSKQQKPFTNMIGKGANIKAIDYSIVQQQPKNAVFFSPTRETKSYNDPEHDKAKKVIYENCRIQSEEIQRAKKYKQTLIRDPNLQQIPSTPVLEGRYNSTWVDKNNQMQKQYSVKRAPSPEPQKIPIMTWGQIQSTPMRIVSQPEYKIQQTDAREKLLQQLNSKIKKQKIIKKNKKNELMQKLMSSVRMSGSSYRKVSMQRQTSQKRNVKLESNNNKVDLLFNAKR